MRGTSIEGKSDYITQYHTGRGIKYPECSFANMAIAFITQHG